MLPAAVAGYAVALLGLACAPAPEPPGPEPPSACELQPQPALAPQLITVALPGAADPRHAPRPRGFAERLLFRHLYETLVRVDCQGRVQPALAETWRSEDDGRRWMFTLDATASFWDGSPVTARHVADSWRRGAPDEGLTTYPPPIDSVLIENDRVLVVQLDSPRPSARLFADPQLAVAAPASDSAWPRGSGPYRLEPSLPPVLTVRPALPAPAPSAAIAFQSFADADPRDLLDSGADVLVTGDPAALDYAAARGDFASAPLAWDRSYVLLSTTRVRALVAAAGATEGVIEPLPADLLEQLAGDAVRGDARAHLPPAWWEDPACGPVRLRVGGELPPIPPGAYQISGPRRIVYERGDGVARDLAERLVAIASLAARPSGPAQALARALPGLLEAGRPLLAVGLEPGDFDAALAGGTEFAFVLGLPRQVYDPCAGLWGLAARVQWLEFHWLEPGDVVLPLVDTRRYVITRPGATRLAVDWAGDLWVGPPDVRR